jgi:hypothetical protein
MKHGYKVPAEPPTRYTPMGYTHAYEGFCEDLARQNAVAYPSQLQLGFRRCRMWVSVIIVVS